MAKDDYFVLAYRVLRFLYECFKVFPRAIGSIRNAKVIDAKITEKGVVFLQENGSIQKAVESLKSAKEIIPGF